MADKLKKTGKIVVIALVVLLIIFNAAIWIKRLVFKEDYPVVGGMSVAVVVSGSMVPTLNVGDLAVYREAESYHPADVIIFDQGGGRVTHRIVAEAPEGFITKGDANNTADAAPVPPTAIKGRLVLGIPFLGTVFLFLKSPLGIILIVAVLLLIIEVPHMIRKE